MVPVLLSLPLLLGSTVLSENVSYSLMFLYTGMSRPSKGLPRFQATAYLNDQTIFNYDSPDGKPVRVEPQGPLEKMQDWKKESQLQRSREGVFLLTLKDIMDSTGSHTFQGMFGCEVTNDRNSGAVWKYAYDGKDFIEFNKDIPAWIPLDPAAASTRLKWEAEKVSLQRDKAYLEEECPAMLKKYLNYSRSQLDRTDTPTVKITSREAPGGNRIFRCLAYDFYPQRISLHWNRAGKKLASEPERAVLPNGNGAYLSWVEVEVPPQNTDPLICSIEHKGVFQSLSVQRDEMKRG